MPKTKFQGAVFGLLMSYIMAFGMEVYNTAIKMGFNLNAGSFSSMTNIVFWEALKETLYMGAIVFFNLKPFRQQNRGEIRRKIL